MDAQRRPAPEITVRDPARPGERLDVLVLGDEQPRSPSFPRRRLPAAVAGLALLTIGAGVLEVRERRAAAEQERRARSALDLLVFPGAGIDVHRTPSGVTLSQLVHLHNDGPRELTLLTGGIGAYGVAHEVLLRPGRRTPVLLEQAVRCTGEPPVPATATTMSLALQTPAGLQQVELELPAPFRDDLAAEVCGRVG